MSIPKIIHYCWFGPKEIPALEQKCIESWKKYLPEYEVMFWNESAFDINSVEYVKQAYEAKKYAFVSDYVRMYVLYTYGGVYLDTDVEVLKDIEKYLTNEAFIGFENRTMVGTGVIACKKHNKIVEQMLDYYKNNNFYDAYGNIDTTTNVKILNSILNKKGLISENSEQIVGDFQIYEREIFSPKRIDSNHFDVSDKTVSIHYFSASWLTEKEKRRGKSLIWRNLFRPILKKLRIMLNKLLGENRTKKIEIGLRKKMR